MSSDDTMVIEQPQAMTYVTGTRSSSVGDSLRQVEMPLRAIYHPLGFNVEIITNDPAVLEAANESWGALGPCRHSPLVQINIGVLEGATSECPPAPSVCLQRHLLSMTAGAENHAFADLDVGFAFAWLTRAAVHHTPYLRYHFLEALALVLISAAFAPALHAACVSRHGRGLLLCGESGAGKSTLAYACARAGFTFTSDDVSYLLRHAGYPRVVGASHKLRFRPHARELFPELGGRQLTPRLEGKPSIEVFTTELPGLITADEASIHALIVLKRGPSTGATLVPAKTCDVLQQLQSALYPTAEIRKAQLADLQQLAATPAYELHYTTLSDAVHTLDQLTRASIPVAG